MNSPVTSTKFEISSAGRLHLTSDCHFGHSNILGYGRSDTFPDLDTMNQGLIERWNSVVRPTDTVLVLGDAAMGKRAETLPLFGQMNGTKHLIAGNHDNCWEHGKNPTKWMDLYLEFFETIHTEGILYTPAGKVRLHHFPYSGDHTEEDRYPHARPDDDGTPLLHGHVHDLWLRRDSEKGTPQVNVGVDVHGFSPIEVSEALRFLGI